MHQSLQGATFHVEHVTPSSKGGPTTLENLAWCCPSCNLHKADRTEGIDPDTAAVVPLFHPRRDRWGEHFNWDGTELVGHTPTARATIAALDLNGDRRQRIRMAEARFDLFPPSPERSRA